MRSLPLSCALVLAALPAFAQSPPAAGSLLVSAPELAVILKQPGVVVIHVAERPAVYEEGHIPGARFLRYGDFAIEGPDGLGSELPSADVAKKVFEAVGVSDDSRVVLYAQSPVIAARAFFTLDALGHRRVAVLDGGLGAWRAAKLALETGAAPAPAHGSFTPKLNASRVADAAFIQQQMAASRIALVDVRPDPEFFGTDGGMGGRHAPGHIAGARQLTWNSLVDSDGKFLPTPQLKQRLEAAGAAASRPVVSYCMVGMRASVVYLVARQLGYDARLYDGSIVDWSKRKLPVVTK